MARERTRGTRRRRGLLLTLVVAALTLTFLPATPASALDFPDCKDSPAPSRPDNGIAGWFATEPKNPPTGNPFEPNAKVSIYDVYGYGGLDFTTYDLGCGGSSRDIGSTSMNTMANIVLTPAMFLVGLDNSVREFAYRPNSMWGWTNDFVKRASDALRDRVFTAWGAVVLAIVGLWLLWGARGGNLSQAAVTAGWAILVMGVVTAVASWPVQASTKADSTLTSSLGYISSGLSQQSADDKREPAVRASGVLTETVLYKQWLRGTLGSAESDTANKYGPRLYEARSISWAEAKEMKSSDKKRQEVIDRKKKLWEDTAAEVKEKDPDAYEYLVGRKSSERMGAAFLALLSAIVVTPFDIMASLLILIAFLIIRLAVAFLPAIGTIGILRPTAGPLRGLLKTVVAAMVNCVIFGAGSAVFLLAVEVITGTNSLAGWQQVLLIWLTGLVLWLLLRPYRRLTQLTGMDPFGELAGGLGKMHKRVFGDMKQLAIASAGAYIGDVHSLEANDKKRADRPENWTRQQKKAARAAEKQTDRQYDADSRQFYADLDEGTLGGRRPAGAARGAQAESSGDVRSRRGGSQRPESMTRRPDGGRSPDRVPVSRGGEPADADYIQTPGRSRVPEETGLVADGESRVIFRPGAGYQRISSGHRVSQAAANAAAAANSAREAVAAAAALTRDVRDRRSG